MRLVSIAFAVCLGLITTGCATAIPYDRTSANVTRVALVTPKLPDEASVQLQSSIGMSFGLVGALVDAGLQENRDDAFNEVLDAQGFDATEVFMDRIREQLTAQGYTSVPLEMERDSDFFPDAAEYPGIQNADAYLDIIVLAYGYAAAGIGDATPYRPHYHIRTRLTRVSDDAVLFEDTVVYNPMVAANQVVTVTADPAYQYVDFDTLMAAPPGQLIEGLRDAAIRTADAMTGLMR
jgi:hypothetical protein